MIRVRNGIPAASIVRVSVFVRSYGKKNWKSPPVRQQLDKWYTDRVSDYPKMMVSDNWELRQTLRQYDRYAAKLEELEKAGVSKEEKQRELSKYFQLEEERDLTAEEEERLKYFQKDPPRGMQGEFVYSEEVPQQPATEYPLFWETDAPGWDINERHLNLQFDDLKGNYVLGSPTDREKSKLAGNESGEGWMDGLGEQHIERRNLTHFPAQKFLVRKTLRMGRHAKVLPGGRVFSTSALVLLGTGEGTAGLGYGKQTEFPKALQAAKLDALRNMVTIHRWQDRTIPYAIYEKFGACKLTMIPGRKGSGRRCNDLIRVITAAFGVNDFIAKTHGSRNPLNVAKCVFKALSSLKDPYMMAIGRGQKLVNSSRIVYKPLVAGQRLQKKNLGLEKDRAEMGYLS